jgi:hypothetical protein
MPGSPGLPTISSNSGNQGSDSQSSQSQQSGTEGSNSSSSNGGIESLPQVAGSQESSGSDQAADSGLENNGASGEQSGSQTGGQTGSQNGGQSSQGQQAGADGGFDGNSTAGAGGSAGGGQTNGDDPFADLSAGRGQVMTASERRAALDARLNEGFAEFDGMILGERERAQSEADEAGSGVMSGGGSGGGGADGGGEGSSASGPIVMASAPPGSTGGGVMPAGNASRQGDFSNNNQPETFPVPEDIPNGNNDDVVARQLREAAMTEPDPELREKLWDEYRAYTGVGQ